MFENDYLMNQVQQLTRFLAQLLLRRQAGLQVDPEELDAALASLCGLPLPALLSMPLPTLLGTLEPHGGNDYARTRLAARLLAARARLPGPADHHPTALAAARKAFLLLDEVSRVAPEALTPEDEAELAALLGELA